MATVYTPSSMKTAGNLAYFIVPVIADIEAPTVAEIDAGVAIHCATRAFDATTNVSTESDQYLCDTEARETPGTRTRTMQPLEFDVADPQSDTDEVLALLPEGGEAYFVLRPGLSHDDPVATGQTAWVYKIQVSAVDPASISATGGGKFGIRAQVTVKERTLVAQIGA